MKKKTFAVLLALVLMLSSVGIAGAITDGTLDGEGHPYVGLLVMYANDGYTYTCSGTLLSATVFLTAGHCANTEEFYRLRVYTESDYFAGPRNPVEAVSWEAHPLYNTAPFFVHDVGVVILEEPGFVLDEYGTLPTAGQLDVLKTKRGKQDVTFTAVGYGMQKSFPSAAGWKDQIDYKRWVAYPKLNQINVPGFTGDFSLLLSNNAHTGGTCFGDSGGPNFLNDTNIVAGVTSYGINGNCAGTGGVFRLDKQDVLDFVTSFLP